MLIGQNLGRQGKLNAGRKGAELEGSHVAPPETDARNLPGKPQPCGYTQINRGELV